MYKRQDLKCLKVGHELNIADYPLTFTKHEGWHDSKIITGNHAIALGAISAGARAYYSYPMTPASSILTYLAETSHESGMLVKQAEDEITAVQMALGSMHMGTRALTGTSGGGFDPVSYTHLDVYKRQELVVFQPITSRPVDPRRAELPH